MRTMHNVIPTMSQHMVSWLAIGIAAMILAGCTLFTSPTTTWSTFSGFEITTDDDLQEAAETVWNAIEAEDYEQWAEFVHPDGVQFMQYGRAESTDVVLSSSQLANAAADTTAYSWWVFDGTWYPIELTISEYMDRFIETLVWRSWDEITYNEVTQYGNVINNIHDTFPNHHIVEWYNDGVDPQYGGMDWGSITFVFEEDNDGVRWLRGIATSQRTT